MYSMNTIRFDKHEDIVSLVQFRAYWGDPLHPKNMNKIYTRFLTLLESYLLSSSPVQGLIPHPKTNDE